METPAEMAEEELTSQAESSYSDFDVDDEKSSVPSALTSYFRRIHELPRQTAKSAEELRTGVIQAEDRFLCIERAHPFIGQCAQWRIFCGGSVYALVGAASG